MKHGSGFRAKYRNMEGSMDANNVVVFPIGPGANPPQTLEEIQRNLANVRAVHIDDAMECLFDVVMLNTGLLGFNFSDEKFDKDLAFLAEAIRSLMSKFYDIEHPFQTQAANTFEIDNEGTTRFIGETEAVLEPA